MSNPSALRETVTESTSIQLSKHPLEVALQVNKYFVLMWLNLLITQQQHFQYTLIELISFFMLSLLDLLRIQLATKGNRCEKVMPLALATFLCFPTLAGYVFFLKLKTHTYPIDNYLTTISLGFLAAEFALSVPAIIAFQRKE